MVGSQRCVRMETLSSFDETVLVRAGMDGYRGLGMLCGGGREEIIFKKNLGEGQMLPG